jgi:hypothetical protein
MTVLGIALVLVGAAVGLTGSTPYNGQWLLGFLIAIAGVAVCGIHTHNTKEKK